MNIFLREIFNHDFVRLGMWYMLIVGMFVTSAASIIS